MEGIERRRDFRSFGSEISNKRVRWKVIYRLLYKLKVFSTHFIWNDAVFEKLFYLKKAISKETEKRLMDDKLKNVDDKQRPEATQSTLL